MGMDFLTSFMGGYDDHEDKLSKRMGFGTGVGTPLYAMNDDREFQSGQNNYGGIANLAMLMNAYAAKAAMAYGSGGAATPALMAGDMPRYGFQPGQLDRGGPLDHMSLANRLNPVNEPASGYWHTQDLEHEQGLPFNDRNGHTVMQTPPGVDFSGYAHAQTHPSGDGFRAPPQPEPSLFMKFMNHQREQRSQPFRVRKPFMLGGMSPSYRDFNPDDSNGGI